MTSSRTVVAPKRKPATFSRVRRNRIKSIAANAAEYYHARGRDFPWRHETNPYRLAVAEILLQKTRAESIVETYRSLMQRFPNARKLANSDVKELEGALRRLGLSRKRALQLNAMAAAVLEYGYAEFADWRTVLADVPGLGTYAARAIACFACEQTVGIVDANVARIIRRVFNLKTDDPRAVVFQRYADEIAKLSPDVRATNFGLLDIGAAICLSRPRCPECPLLTDCAYGRRRTGIVQQG